MGGELDLITPDLDNYVVLRRLITLIILNLKIYKIWKMTFSLCRLPFLVTRSPSVSETLEQIPKPFWTSESEIPGWYL